jgi:hypothetical protein
VVASRLLTYASLAISKFSLLSFWATILYICIHCQYTIRMCTKFGRYKYMIRLTFGHLLLERSYVKSIQTSIGNYVQYMEPGYLQRSLHPDGNTKVAPLIPRSAHWLSLPYFSLEPYSGLLSASSPSVYPIQTLLQSQLSRATRDRDMQQAVCQNTSIAAGLCFHIDQLWCIVLDNCKCCW